MTYWLYKIQSDVFVLWRKKYVHGDVSTFNDAPFQNSCPRWYVLPDAFMESLAHRGLALHCTALKQNSRICNALQFPRVHTPEQQERSNAYFGLYVVLYCTPTKFSLFR